MNKNSCWIFCVSVDVAQRRPADPTATFSCFSHRKQLKIRFSSMESKCDDSAETAQMQQVQLHDTPSDIDSSDADVSPNALRDSVLRMLTSTTQFVDSYDADEEYSATVSINNNMNNEVGIHEILLANTDRKKSLA